MRRMFTLDARNERQGARDVPGLAGRIDLVAGARVDKQNKRMDWL